MDRSYLCFARFAGLLIAVAPTPVFFAAPTHAQERPQKPNCVDVGGGWDACGDYESEPPSCPEGTGLCYAHHPWDPRTYPATSWLNPIPHFKVDRSTVIPWVGTQGEVEKLLSSGNYRVVAYSLNPGHAANKGWGQGSEWAPTRFSQPPEGLADDESVYKVSVFIPDNKWGQNTGYFTGMTRSDSKQIYIPPVVEVNAIDDNGKRVHYVQFRGYNGTNKGHSITVHIFIQKSKPVFVRR